MAADGPTLLSLSLLRIILPSQFGICRGFVVAQDGERAGDDTIIFDRVRFPTLAMRGQDDFSWKEYIPIEAVFGYLEAKYTLNLDGDDGQSLAKSTRQVAAVKPLYNRRRRIEYSDLRHVTLGNLIKGHPDSE